MSSSWAKPSWKVPEPSRAKLGTSPSCIFFWHMIPFFIIVVANFSTQNNSFSNKKKYYSPQRTQKKEWKCWGNKGKNQIGKKVYFLRHKMTNSGEKPYYYRYCDLRFSQSLCAKIQERTHTWEKPYDCRIESTYYISSWRETLTNLKNVAFSFLFYILWKYIWYFHENKTCFSIYYLLNNWYSSLKYLLE